VVYLSALVTRIDTDREHGNLSSTIRLYVLNHYRGLADEAAPGRSKMKRS
jgi:predicted DNA-binding ribbon-helix-helix protein